MACPIALGGHNQEKQPQKKRELLDTVKARKLAYYGQNMRKQGNCLEKEIMQGTMPGARKRARPCTAWIDNIKTWTGLYVEESIRMTENRDKWRKYVHGGQPSDRGRPRNRTEHVTTALDNIRIMSRAIWEFAILSEIQR